MKDINKFIKSSLFPPKIVFNIKERNHFPTPSPNEVNARQVQPHGMTKQRPHKQNQGEPSVRGGTSLSDNDAINKPINDQGIVSVNT